MPDGNFGLSLTNPIPAADSSEVDRYLSRLYTLSGRPAKSTYLGLRFRNSVLSFRVETDNQEVNVFFRLGCPNTASDPPSIHFRMGTALPSPSVTTASGKVPEVWICREPLDGER